MRSYMSLCDSWYFSFYFEEYGDVWQKFEGYVLFGWLGGGEK